MTRKLQITLYFVAAYLAVFGMLFVFAPGVFERITETTLPDAKLTLLYGTYTLIFAFVALMAAREKEAASKVVAHDSAGYGRECRRVRLSTAHGERRLFSGWPAADRQPHIDSTFASFQETGGGWSSK